MTLILLGFFEFLLFGAETVKKLIPSYFEALQLFCMLHCMFLFYQTFLCFVVMLVLVAGMGLNYLSLLLQYLNVFYVGF